MDESEKPSRLALPLLYGSPVLAAAVTVTVQTAVEEGWLPLYGRGAFVPYLDGSLAVFGSAAAGLMLSGGVGFRVAMAVVYGGFGLLIYGAALVCLTFAMFLLLRA